MENRNDRRVYSLRSGLLLFMGTAVVLAMAAAFDREATGVGMLVLTLFWIYWALNFIPRSAAWFWLGLMFVSLSAFACIFTFKYFRPTHWDLIGAAAEWCLLVQVILLPAAFCLQQMPVEAPYTYALCLWLGIFLLATCRLWLGWRQKLPVDVEKSARLEPIPAPQKP